MTQVTGRYRGQQIYHLVYHELIMAARYRGYVTYQEIAKMMGLQLSGSHMGREVGRIIGEISDDEISNGRPMLSALVVDGSGKIHDGFYKWAKDLGRFKGETEDERMQFWVSERAKVYDTWKIVLEHGTKTDR